MASTSSTSPSLPSGYTYKALLGAAKTDSSSTLYLFQQVDNRAWFRSQHQILDGTADDAWTSLDLTDFVPVTAKGVGITFIGPGVGCGLAPDANGFGGEYQVGGSAGAGRDFDDVLSDSASHVVTLSCYLNKDGGVYYYVAVSGAVLDLSYWWY